MEKINQNTILYVMMYLVFQLAVRYNQILPVSNFQNKYTFNCETEFLQ